MLSKFFIERPIFASVISIVIVIAGLVSLPFFGQELLPSFKGLHGQKQALEYGVRYSGCTVHFVDAGIDTGPIIIQKVVPVMQDDDEESLSARILEQEHRAYPEAVRLFAEGRLKAVGRRVNILDDSEKGS